MWCYFKCEYVGNIIDEINNCHSMSDLDIMLDQVEQDTGYSKDFLWEVNRDCYEADKGEIPLAEIWESTITTAYEGDF